MILAEYNYIKHPTIKYKKIRCVNFEKCKNYIDRMESLGLKKYKCFPCKKLK